VNGGTVEFQYLEKLVGLLMLAGSDGVRGKRHPYFDTLDHMIGLKGVPNESMAELTSALAGRQPDRFLGHDSIDQFKAIKAIIKAAGLPEKWGHCPTCKGTTEIEQTKSEATAK
jgi:hypothetical protein